MLRSKKLDNYKDIINTEEKARSEDQGEERKRLDCKERSESGSTVRRGNLINTE